MSRAVLKAAGVKSVIVVSEPYHLWRVERLARATGFDRALRGAVRRRADLLLAALGHGFQGRVARAAGHRGTLVLLVQWHTSGPAESVRGMSEKG